MSIRSKDILALVFIMSLVLGPVASYYKFYLFHFVLISFYFSVFLLNKYPVRKIILLKPLCFFVGFLFLSLIWAPNIVNGLKFIFYIFCGFSIIFYYVIFCDDEKDLLKLVNITIFFLGVNFFVGIFETISLFRMPLSDKYSGSEYLNSLGFSPPSGFAGNLNNFGFIYIIFFPFLAYHNNLKLRYASYALLVWFAICLQSRGFYFAAIVFLLLRFVDFKKSRLFFILTLGFFGFFGFIFIFDFSEWFQNYIEFKDYIFYSRDQSNFDSNKIRLFMYIKGVEEFFYSYGLGLGVAGIGTILAKDTNLFEGGNLFSFHNFFLEQLIDLGGVIFIFMFIWYCGLIKNSFKAISKNENNEIVYLGKSSFASLIVVIPASISPSSIVYILPFWALLAIAICLKFICQKKEFNV